MVLFCKRLVKANDSRTHLSTLYRDGYVDTSPRTALLNGLLEAVLQRTQ